MSTDNFEWGYFILGFIMYQLLKMVALSASQLLRERRAKKFLKLVLVEFPNDKPKVTFISLDSSDRRAFKQMKQQILEMHDVPDEVHDKLRRKA